MEKKAPALPVDLQLPTKGPAIKSYGAQEETNKTEEEEVDVKPKARWVSAFQEVDESKPDESDLIKSEPVEEKPAEALSTIPEVPKEPTTEAAESAKQSETEKIVTLKSEKSSSKKPVVFKKRKNEGQNLRERLDD